jgi:anti-anti-sigma regulatory factor
MTTLMPADILKVSLTTRGSYSTVRFEGALVADTVQAVQAAVDSLGSLRCEVVVVDLRAVNQCDAVGQSVISGLLSYLGGRGVRGLIRAGSSSIASQIVATAWTDS